MNTRKTDEELWQEVLDVFEDNREAVKPSPQEVCELSQGGRRVAPVLRRVAAVALVAFLLGGLAWAAVRLAVPRQEPCAVSLDTVAPNPADGEEAPADSAILFANARLDSLLAIVARHYGRTLCIQSEDVAGLRVLTRWYVSRPLSAFVESMNEFEGLHLADQGDTLFVSCEKEEERP